MNKIDIVQAVKNKQKIFTPENMICPDEPCFQKVAEAIIETEIQGYITGVIPLSTRETPTIIAKVLIEGEITPLGEELLEMDKAKGAFY
jgi:hypothetical protein